MAGENFEAIIRRIDAQINAGGGFTKFSEDEAIEIRRMISVFRFFLNLGRLGRALVWVLLTAAAAVAAFEQLLKTGGNP